MLTSRALRCGATIALLVFSQFSAVAHAQELGAPTQPQLLEMERTLHRLKIPTGKVDGVVDGQTRRALCAWRELSGQEFHRDLPTQNDLYEISKTEILFPTTDMRIGLNVNLKCQSAVWIQEDISEPVKVFKVSSGRATFETIPGSFKVGWLIDDWYESRTYPEGWMYRPQFFNAGQAIHGSLEDSMVHSYPASHGCLRLPRKDIDFLWSIGFGRGSAVKIYEQWVG